MSEQSNLPDVSPKVTFGTPTPNEWKQFLRSVQHKPMEGQKADSSPSSEESSFELEESFRALLERKRREMAENLRDLSEPRENPPVESGARMAASIGDDSTFIEADSMSKVSDTSFEEMEQICALLEKANKPGVEGGEPSEAVGATVEKMGQDALVQDSSGFGDVTQLDDVDEPSGLWENTILPGIAAALSPVKRLHLLRPSTIIEESSMVGGEMRSSLETNTTQDTFESAKQAVEVANGSSAVSGSDVYRTAEEDTFASSIGSYAQTTEMDSKMYSDLSGSIKQTTYMNMVEHEEEESGYSQNSTREAGSSEIEESNIIILDSSTSEAEEDGKLQEETEMTSATHTDPVNISEEEDHHRVQPEERPLSSNGNESQNMSGLDEIPDHFNDTFEETDFMMRQGMKLMAMRQQQQQSAQGENQLHAPQKPRESPAKCVAPSYLEPRHVAPNVSIHQQRSAQKQVKSRINSDSEESTIVRSRNQTTFERTNLKGQALSASKLTPVGTTISKKNTPASTGSCKQTLFSSAGKYGARNTPSNTSISGSFKKPISRLPQPSKLTRKFEHIQSPIGAYIKKTPQSLLQTKITCPQHDLIEVLHSEQGRDSVMSGGKSKENYNALANGALNVKGYISSIPGKGVVSSNRAHVLDERNALRIPGGEKMQKLLHSSPTLVIRHEGRIRYASEAAGTTHKRMASNNTLQDDSLADLSVVSSDVSVRVLKDAKRY